MSESIFSSKNYDSKMLLDSILEITNSLKLLKLLLDKYLSREFSKTTIIANWINLTDDMQKNIHSIKYEYTEELKRECL